MATGINRVQFFIYVLCIVYVLCSGGAAGYIIPPPSVHCIPRMSCPSNIQMCLDYCEERGFSTGIGKCVREDLCCCIR
ncbi:hypothetical protein MtrunA17_Chr2g0316071 [Medicago truncatula]|uniref:LCR-like protein n=1 Tax=Medicago truncatula TaxID=3880 RepID=A0A396JF17_MEDTR|nr:hypothetical protein MtrunA17_Chr2g0316071 [Medicago truncatula]